MKLRGLLPHAVVEYHVDDGGDGLVGGSFRLVELAGELVWLVLRVVNSEAFLGAAAERWRGAGEYRSGREGLRVGAGPGEDVWRVG